MKPASLAEVISEVYASRGQSSVFRIPGVFPYDEQWDVSQEIPDKMAHNNDMF